MNDMGIEEVVKNGLETGKGFRIVYELKFASVEESKNEGVVVLHADGNMSVFQLEPLSYSEIGNAVKRLVEEKYGKLEYLFGGLRTEKFGNDKVEVDFDPGWGSFVIDVRVK